MCYQRVELAHARKHTAYNPDERNRRWIPLWGLNVDGLLGSGGGHAYDDWYEKRFRWRARFAYYQAKRL